MFSRGASHQSEHPESIHHLWETVNFQRRLEVDQLQRITNTRVPASQETPDQTPRCLFVRLRRFVRAFVCSQASAVVCMFALLTLHVSSSIINGVGSLAAGKTMWSLSTGTINPESDGGYRTSLSSG